MTTTSVNLFNEKDAKPSAVVLSNMSGEFIVLRPSAGLTVSLPGTDDAAAEYARKLAYVLLDVAHQCEQRVLVNKGREVQVPA